MCSKIKLYASNSKKKKKNNQIKKNIINVFFRFISFIYFFRLKNLLDLIIILKEILKYIK